MHRLNAPVFCVDQHGLSVPDLINEFPNRVRPDQMSHTTASDLGIIDLYASIIQGRFHSKNK